jgi:hypothetical protein
MSEFVEIIDRHAAVALASCPSPSMIIPDARSLPRGLAQLPKKLGR